LKQAVFGTGFLGAAHVHSFVNKSLLSGWWFDFRFDLLLDLLLLKNCKTGR